MAVSGRPPASLPPPLFWWLVSREAMALWMSAWFCESHQTAALLAPPGRVRWTLPSRAAAAVDGAAHSGPRPHPSPPSVRIGTVSDACFLRAGRSLPDAESVLRAGVASCCELGAVSGNLRAWKQGFAWSDG